ncbi:beta-1,3-galactosyl-O-glycosyl-glycoprotein beta-1,6-N-acetylglucosaminyltransferase [Elysia marginata]|uniref:Beta-1,3-galactosyl-O-glycosyl-glycoprotein beta-1,6-N-acetylglucosaminyltransferase n=1 Tax=Elysia marginata TaxID=1093978 RepID=A0AAV4HXZ2_9GAST|nr:beta-1,3-galactosyl-O-glycosyl-glycoprotein beta-1,6-N-acetylglucosaminyltransferase [Elysia marginata]
MQEFYQLRALGSSMNLGPSIPTTLREWKHWMQWKVGAVFVVPEETIAAVFVVPEETIAAVFLMIMLPHYQQTRVNCSALFSGDKVEIEKDIALASLIAKDEEMAERMQGYPKSTKSTKYFADKSFGSEVEKWSREFQRLTNQWYINATKDCQAFKRTRGYIMSPLTREEGEFPIAFSIVAFKDVEMVERLLRIVYRPQNRYCIHVDSKADAEFYSALKAVAACFPGNVRMSSRRVDVRWGTFTVLEPELICMQDLWDMDNNFNLNAGTSQNSVRNEQQNKKKWKYFINLTGQEFPLKTNFELVQILKTFKGANHEEGTRKRADSGRWPSTPPHGIIPTKGGVHTLLNRATVDFILHNEKAADFIDWLRSTGIPDETLFASINYNPQLNIPGTYNGNKMENIEPLTRYKMWYGHNCYSGQTVRGVCILSTGDLHRLGEAPHLFANKFYLHQDRVVIGCLEEKLFNDTRDEYLGTKIFNTTFYAQQEFVKHQVPGDPFRL